MLTSWCCSILIFLLLNTCLWQRVASQPDCSAFPGLQGNNPQNGACNVYWKLGEVEYWGSGNRSTGVKSPCFTKNPQQSYPANCYLYYALNMKGQGVNSCTSQSDSVFYNMQIYCLKLISINGYTCLVQHIVLLWLSFSDAAFQMWPTLQVMQQHLYSAIS